MGDIVGKVVWFNNERGFGFLSADDKDEYEGDIFFHYSSISTKGYKTIDNGQAVKFTVKETEKGFEAQDVCII